MNKQKLIDRVRELFDSDFREEIRRDAGLKDVCHALKRKKQDLKSAIDASEDEERRAQLQSQYDVVCAQHRKAVKLRLKKKREKKRD